MFIYSEKTYKGKVIYIDSINPKKKKILTQCIFCGKDTLQHISNFYFKNKIFCNIFCENQYNLKNKDILNYNIVKNKNENFYYLIGLIVTDGNIEYEHKNKRGEIKCKGVNCCTITSIKKEHLEMIKKKLGGKLTPRRYGKHNEKTAYRLRFFNIELVNYLRYTVGITHNKTYNMNISLWFSTLKEKQKWWFWRGVVDGDGSIFLSKKNKIYPCLVYTLSISSVSQPFLNMILNFFKIGNLSKTEFRVSRNKEIVKILSKIYKNISKKSLYLSYKYEKYKKIMAIESFMKTNKLKSYKYESLAFLANS